MMEQTSGLTGRTAIVTGAGRGIGRAIARRLGAAGANIVVASRTAEQLDETRRLIEQGDGKVLAVPCDVSAEEDVERLISETRSLFGRIDILVNNAGTAALATIDRMEPQVFDEILAGNVRTVYLCSRGVWGHMAEAGGGAIVNISSISAYDPFCGYAAYGAAKAFVNTYTKALAAEGRSCGIRLYGIAPAAVETQMLRGAFPDFPAADTLDPDDVACLVETLLSPGCRHISGETIVIRKN